MPANFPPDDSGQSGGAGHDPQSDDDAALVLRCQQGDVSAFDALVSAHRDKIYAMTLKMVRNEADAWDLSQEIFVKVWRALPKFEARAKFSTWLYRIAHNAVYDFKRKTKGKLTSELNDEIFDSGDVQDGAPTAPSEALRPDRAMQRDELRQKIEQALAKLSEAHRETIILRELQGLDYKEIADVMDCSIGTVMSRLYYARKKLQTDLKDE